MSAQIKIIDGMSKNIVLPKLNSASSHDMVRSRSPSTRSYRETKTHSNELLNIPRKSDYRSTSKGIDRSIVISDDCDSTTVTSTLA